MEFTKAKLMTKVHGKFFKTKEAMVWQDVVEVSALTRRLSEVEGSFLGAMVGYLPKKQAYLYESHSMRIISNKFI